MPVHGAVVAKVRGNVIQLATGVQAEDHPIEHRPQAGVVMPLGLGGVERVEGFGQPSLPPWLFRVCLVSSPLQKGDEV